MKIDSALRSGTSPLPEGQTRVEPPTGADASVSEAGAGPDAAPAVARAVGADADAMVAAPARRPLSIRAKWRLGLALLALVIVFLLIVRTVLRPFIWAAVVCYILTPVVSLVQRRLRLKHGMSVAVVMLALIGLIAWGSTVAVPILQSDVLALSNSISSLNTFLTAYLPNQGTPSILGIPVQVTSIVRSAQLAIGDLPQMVVRDGFSVASNAVGMVLHFLTFLIATFYLLLDAPRLGTWLTRRIPSSARDETVALGRRVDRVLSEYLRAEVTLILIMSTASLIAMTILGVHFALLLAPLVGFLEIFPIIGPFCAITVVTVVALIGPPNFGLSHVSYGVIVALVFFIMRQLEDYLVVPRVLGHAIKLHPLVILFALLCGAATAGILGMFLAVPVLGALRVLGGYAYDRLVE